MLQRIGRLSLREQVARALEERILDGTYPDDARLPTESELQEQLGVSRTVVRDALRMLEVRGLIEIRRGSGTTVKRVPTDAYASAVATMLLRSQLTIGDVFEARATLESQFAIVAARNHTVELIERVALALDRFEAAVRERTDAAEIVNGHVGFHTELLRATNLPALEILLCPIQEMMLATSVGPRGSDPREPTAWRVGIHRALLDAVASRDEEKVARACEKHWSTPLRDRQYAETRSLRISAMFATPAQLVAIPGGTVADG
ncbi:MAG: FadR/GntR family transcriptional regulator [Gaiellales bacterium]